METGIAVVSVIIPIAFLITVGFIVWASVSAKNRRAAMQAEVQTRLIEKFSSAPEFVEFLNSDTGKQFLSGIDKMPQMMARDRIVGGVSRGVLLTLLGAAFLAIWGADGNIGFMYPGFILLGLGIGFFISTMVALKLSHRYGLIGNDQPTARELQSQP